MKLGRVVRAIRVHLFVSQTDWAERLKISRSYLSEMEGDKRNFTIPILERVEKLSNLKVFEIFALEAQTRKLKRLDRLHLAIRDYFDKKSCSPIAKSAS